MAPLFDTSRLRSEEGFTLAELLAAMAISLIVVFATLTTLDTFSTNAARQTRVTDANDQVRGAMDRVVADLRQAATIEVAGANDLVYTVADSGTATRRERICVDASKQLWRSSVTTATAPSVAIASGTTCPTAGSGAVKVTTLLSANSASAPMFRYDSATPSSVRSVGLTFALDAGNSGHTDTSVLRASAFVRSRSEAAPAVADDDIGATCSDGVPTLTLSSSVGDLGVTYTDLDGNELGSGNAGSSLQLTGAGSTVIANITSTRAGIVSQLVKEIEC